MTHTLMHYADAPLAFDADRTYVQGEPYAFRKPEGLWVSVQGEDDWPSWCSREEYAPNRLRHSHQVRLFRDANILMINSSAELLDFTDAYAVQTDWERRWDWKRDNKRQWPIDWRQVAMQYDGIIIAPYQWQCRSAVDWYYGWDCASGCIWNLSAIVSVESMAVTS